MNYLIGSPIFGYDWTTEPWSTMVALLQTPGMTLAKFTSEVSPEDMGRVHERWWPRAAGFWIELGKATALLPNQRFIYEELYPWLMITCQIPHVYFRTRDKRRVSLLWLYGTRFLQEWNFVLICRLLETRCIRILESDADLLAHLMWPNHEARFWRLVRLLLDHGLQYKPSPNRKHHRQESKILDLQERRTQIRMCCCIILKSPLLCADLRRLIAQCIWKNRW